VSDVVVFAQPGSPRRWILHRPEDPYGDGHVYFLRVELRDDGLSAEGRSALDGRDARDLPTFLNHLVDCWRGWDGALSWTSLEGEMTLEATHHGRFVAIAITLRRPTHTREPDSWSARIVLTLEPGEELRTLAREASLVLTPDDRR
jgi:hypothetical protein